MNIENKLIFLKFLFMDRAGLLGELEQYTMHYNNALLSEPELDQRLCDILKVNQQKDRVTF